MNAATEYLVLNDHTLCYSYGEDKSKEIEPFRFVYVLAAKIIQGSPYSWLTGQIVIGPHDKVRPATREDFLSFNVDPKGHL